MANVLYSPVFGFAPPTGKEWKGMGLFLEFASSISTMKTDIQSDTELRRKVINDYNVELTNEQSSPQRFAC